MNILPLILALVLMLSVLAVEKLEKFKNQTVVQREYQVFLKMIERQVFNKRQKGLFGENEKSLRQLSFRFLVDKKARDGNANAAKQYRMLILELMKIVYGEAAFFKNLEKKRPNFLEEMLNAIEQAADAAPKKLINRIQDIARLNLEDPELQEAFYHMLKGTIEREKLKEMKEVKPAFKEKAYVTLFKFIHYNGKEHTPRIVVQLAPREILKAIFESDEVVDAIIVRRNELAVNKDSGSETAFKNEFNDKRRTGLDNNLLDFKISSGKKDAYN
jgi:hypothetical protein